MYASTDSLQFSINTTCLCVHDTPTLCRRPADRCQPLVVRPALRRPTTPSHGLPPPALAGCALAAAAAAVVDATLSLQGRQQLLQAFDQVRVHAACVLHCRQCTQNCVHLAASWRHGSQRIPAQCALELQKWCALSNVHRGLIIVMACTLLSRHRCWREPCAPQLNSSSRQ